MADQTQTEQSSSSGSGQQTGGTSQQGTTSATTQTQQQAASQQQAQAPVRPDYIPESHWDATAGKVKDDKALAGHFNEIIARDAAEQSRRLTLPKAEDFKLDLPASFQLPQGAEFKIDTDNPLWSQARTIANKHGLSQEAFSDFIGLVAGDRVGTEQAVNTARNAEIAKLGTTGPARVTAIETFFKAHLGDADGARMTARLFTAADVQAAEKLVAKFAAAGIGGMNTGKREPDGGQKVTQEQYDKMTYTERKEYAARHSQAA